MIKYMEGTVFNAPVKTYVNTVNCSGVMGAGIALEFKLRYPEMYQQYVEQCNNKKIKIGIPRIYEFSDRIWIMNFPTKGHWRFPSKMVWIEEGLKYFVQNYKKRNIESIAFPKLGTNNGGLNWDEVKILMEKYLDNLDINVYICLDEKKEAEGIEKEMVDMLNRLTLERINTEIKISNKQSELIFSNLPCERLWHISKVNKITKDTYEKLFTYLYERTEGYARLIQNQKNNDIDKGEQLSLF